MKKPAILIETDDGTPHRFVGRYAWTLKELIDRGPKGCTPIERPAPRWSHYVHILRQAGLNIETIDEKHGGAFSGIHGRYVLHTPVKIIECSVGAQ